MDGLTATQLTVIVAALGGVAAAIRWGVGVLRDEQQATRKTYAELLASSNAVIAKNSDAFARLTEWLGRVDVRTESTLDRVVEVHSEISGVHEAPVIHDAPPSRPTPRPGEVSIAKGSGGHGGGVVLSPTDTDDDARGLPAGISAAEWRRGNNDDTPIEIPMPAGSRATPPAGTASVGRVKGGAYGLRQRKGTQGGDR